MVRKGEWIQLDQMFPCPGDHFSCTGGKGGSQCAFGTDTTMPLCEVCGSDYVRMTDGRCMSCSDGSVSR